MRNVRALIAYDGSKFFGWQRQEGFDSVQQALEEGLEALTGAHVVAHGAGRTDTGVHALGQVASFLIDTPLADDRLRHALNAHLPEGVVVRRLETCSDDFHAQFSARGKRYAYVVCTSRFRLPFAREHTHWVRDPLDLRAMREACARFVGRRDFAALASTGSPRSSTVRTVRSAHLRARRSGFAFVVEGDGFLYNMVRTMAGTLIEVGRGQRSPADVTRLLESLDRTQAGPTAPAGGLYLLSVLYDERPFRAPDRGPRGTPGLFA